MFEVDKAYLLAAGVVDRMQGVGLGEMLCRSIQYHMICPELLAAGMGGRLLLCIPAKDVAQEKERRDDVAVQSHPPNGLEHLIVLPPVGSLLGSLVDQARHSRLVMQGHLLVEDPSSAGTAGRRHVIRTRNGRFDDPQEKVAPRSGSEQRQQLRVCCEQ